MLLYHLIYHVPSFKLIWWEDVRQTFSSPQKLETPCYIYSYFCEELLGIDRPFGVLAALRLGGITKISTGTCTVRFFCQREHKSVRQLLIVKNVFSDNLSSWQRHRLQRKTEWKRLIGFNWLRKSANFLFEIVKPLYPRVEEKIKSRFAATFHQSLRGTCTPTIIRNKQSDVSVFYFPHCFIVCALVRRLAGAPVIYRSTWGMQPAPLGAPPYCYMLWWTILEFLLFCIGLHKLTLYCPQVNKYYDDGYN